MCYAVAVCVDISSSRWCCCLLSRNLDETTRAVYKDNMRINEALSYHMTEGDTLKKAKVRLESNNKVLNDEMEMDKMVIEKKVWQGHRQKLTIKQVDLCCIWIRLRCCAAFCIYIWMVLCTRPHLSTRQVYTIQLTASHVISQNWAMFTLTSYYIWR